MPRAERDPAGLRQRALPRVSAGVRGRTGGGDFWEWREAMLTLARCQTPESVKTEYVATYEELLHSGYTAVGEFHYLGFETALRQRRPRRRSGSSWCCSTPRTPSRRSPSPPSRRTSTTSSASAGVGSRSAWRPTPSA